MAAMEQAAAAKELQLSLPMDAPEPVSLPPMQEGMWKIGDRVFKVQIAHHGSGKMYCKELLVQEYKTPEGEVLAPTSHSWEFRPGFLGTLRKEGTQMTLEEACEYGALYGFCCSCGRILTNETSIELGIGPVCREKFAA